MARPKKVSDEVVETPEIEAEVVETPVKAKETTYPEVAGTGKFQAVEATGGFVVYNPCGQRVTGIVNDVEAQDIVRANNIAAHLK